MKSSGAVWVATVGTLLAAVPPGRAPAEAEDWPYRGLKIPVELYPDGAVRVQMTAGAARTLPNGVTEARDVRVEMLNPDGKTVEGWAEVSLCRYDPSSGVLTSSNEVRMQRGVLGVTGVGLEVRSREQKMLLHQRVRVVVKPSALPEAQGGR